MSEVGRDPHIADVPIVSDQTLDHCGSALTQMFWNEKVMVPNTPRHEKSKMPGSLTAQLQPLGRLLVGHSNHKPLHRKAATQAWDSI